jgi:uncharacterized protein (TIGR03790 family)
MTQLRSAILSVGMLLCTGGTAAPPTVRFDPSTVLIVVNDNTPPETGTGGVNAGQYVAERYAAARGVPLGNIAHIRTTMACCDSNPKAWDSWNISWEEFVNDVREPLKAYLKASGLARKIRYIVPTYGVPSHIESHPHGIAGLSVDSFLPLMSSRYADVIPMDNPAYSPDPQVMPRFPTKAYGGPYYIVSRLDGPSAEIAAGLVDKALAAERGISRKSGTGYFDWRHLSESGGGYYVADQTMVGGYESCVSTGLQCVLNDQTATGGMIANAPGALWAWGWYSGAVTNDVYSFAPGAVGAQLTSYTAGSIRYQRPGAWVPLWLERGITATWGATGEPYVDRYTAGDALLNRLWNGYTFGEAVHLATPKLNWKMVFVGDPLYSPKFVD